MRTDAEQVTLAYIEAVHRRLHEPVQPPDFTPDWTDRPLPHTYHPGAERIALPFPAQPAPSRPDGADGGALGLETLAADLQASIGVLARRYQIDWNAELTEQAAPHTARWGRGASSGGGTYPLEVYWAAGPSAPVPAGVYHYASGLHAMERLSGQDPTAAVRAAIGPGAGSVGDQFLLCTVRLWKNSFKYHNVAYHLATLDLGSLTACWSLLSRDRGAPYRQRLWFDESALNGLLGLDPGEESVHAVIPLPWRAAQPRVAVRPAGAVGVRPSRYERSRTVRRFALADAVLRATADAPPTAPGRTPANRLGTPPAPAPACAAGRTEPSGPGWVPLAAETRDPLAGRAAATLAARTSSAGRIDGGRPLGLYRLAEVVRAALTTDAPSTGEPGGLVALTVVARAVDGLAPGAYAYAPGRHALSRLPGDALSVLTQDLYGLDNYAVGDVPATLVFHWHPEQAISAYGPRAYRAANVEAGAAAQRAHLAATALGLSSGIVLGLDPVPLDAALGLTERGRHSQLYLFLGHARAGAAGLDGRLR